jgi:hypothetical protein
LKRIMQVPYKPPRPCRFAGCVNTTTAKTGYCDKHAHLYKPFVYPDKGRPPASRRGYDGAWAKIRAAVLRQHGIPRQDWKLYDVHHNPPYNPDAEPDHLRYALIPVLHAEHTRLTNGGMRRGKNNLQGAGGV